MTLLRERIDCSIDEGQGYKNRKRNHKGVNIRSNHEEFACHIRNNLSQSVGEKWIDPKFLYDKRGSNLFEQICLQPEYYLSRSEVEILRRFSKDIVSSLNCVDASMVEFGSGNSIKTRIILEQFVSQDIAVSYFPIDISHSALVSSVRKLSSEFNNLNIIGVSCEYLEGIKRICSLMNSSTSMPPKKVMFFLGSSIGNFEPDKTRSFLKSMKANLRSDARDSLFISFDLEKDFRILESAYNDKAGKTSEFNLNLLERINRDLGGRFKLKNFSHCATYNRIKKRIEMYIVSKRDQEIYVRDLGQTISLKQNERIHTENSYKYSVEEISQMADESGLVITRNYFDSKMRFDLASFSTG